MRQLIFTLTLTLLILSVHLLSPPIFAQSAIQVSQPEIGFIIPDFADILTFLVRAFFVIAGLAALFYLLLGAFSWVTSGGDKDSIKAAQDKITAAVIGVILIVAVLAIVVTLETIVFQKRICFGVSCPASIPGLITGCIPDPQYSGYGLGGSGSNKCCSNAKGVGYTVESERNAGDKKNLKCCTIGNNTTYDISCPSSGARAAFCPSATSSVIAITQGLDTDGDGLCN